jgi:hypothetical protein
MVSVVSMARDGIERLTLDCRGASSTLMQEIASGYVFLDSLTVLYSNFEI